MANSTKQKADTEVVNDSPIVNRRVNESVYTAEEFAENHKLFGTTYEIVAVAFRISGKKSATVTEAKNIIEKFKNREVK